MTPMEAMAEQERKRHAKAWGLGRRGAVPKSMGEAQLEACRQAGRAFHPHSIDKMARQDRLIDLFAEGKTLDAMARIEQVDKRTISKDMRELRNSGRIDA